MALQKLIQQGRTFTVESERTDLVRWRTSALTMIAQVYPPDHMAWGLVPAIDIAQFCVDWNRYPAIRQTDLATGWSAPLGVLEALELELEEQLEDDASTPRRALMELPAPQRLALSS